jgi:GT2 family glycosyltransferase
MDLSIVVISWNTKQLLRDCLESIYKSTHNISFEIIVVDNASIDGSVEMVKNEFSKIILIENDVNVGFAKANNIAFPFASGSYVLLLNSDTVVQLGALDSAVGFMNQHHDVGGLTPKILNSDGTIQHPGYIKEPSLETEIYDAFELRRVLKLERTDTRAAESEVYDVAHACGCSLFLRKDALVRIGYLDERMIFSFEDADICMRVRKDGWRITYFPESRIVHLGGASRSKHNNRAVNAMLQSKYVFFRKYYGGLYLIALAIILISSSLIKMFIYAVLSLQVTKRSQRTSSLRYYWSIIRWHFKLNSDESGMGG